MIRDKYADKIMHLIELDAPVAATHHEVKYLLKAYFMEQIADFAENDAMAHLDLEDTIERIVRGESL